MAGTYELVITGSGAGEFMQNVLHFQLNEAGSGTLFEYAEGLANQFITDVLPSFLDCLCGDYNCSSIRAKKVSGSGGPTAVIGFPTGTQLGSRAGQIGSTQQAMLLNFPVVLNGKNVTGKSFMAGVSQDDITQNAVGPALNGAAGTYLTALIAGMTLPTTLGTATFCIFNRATQTSTIVLAGYVSPLIGTQRRRLHPV